MPTLDGITIKEVHEIHCPDHGRIAVEASPEAARAWQRHHFEWRHQPNPEGRTCGWRYPLGGGGHRTCVLEAAHLDWMHRGDDGMNFSEIGSLPREGLDYGSVVR